ITTRYTGWLDSRTTSQSKSAAYHRNTGRQGGLKGGIASGEARRAATRQRIMEAISNGHS
ncbi:MAG: hypothetical protein L0L36_15260, partial [Brevibacterium sp.]|nr:hypothetical protein [Brevibacterium sp.]